MEFTEEGQCVAGLEERLNGKECRLLGMLFAPPGRRERRRENGRLRAGKARANIDSFEVR